MRIAKSVANSGEPAFVPLYAPTTRYRIRNALKSVVGQGSSHGRGPVIASAPGGPETLEVTEAAEVRVEQPPAVDLPERDAAPVEPDVLPAERQIAPAAPTEGRPVYVPRANSAVRIRARESGADAQDFAGVD